MFLPLLALDAGRNACSGPRGRIVPTTFFDIHFVALHPHSQVLDHLKGKKLLQRYSVQDMQTYLSKVYVVEVDGKDRIGEGNHQIKPVIELLEIPIAERRKFPGRN